MNSIFDAYLSGSAGGFYPTHFADAAARRSAVRRAARPLAPAVGDELAAQNAALAPSPARERHVAALREGAAAVVTGQQVGLFLGPLFTLYKAASAIAVARALTAESGQPVVPVFWLQTEDHDLPEIATCHVARSRGEPLALSLPAAADERVSIAHRTLPEEIEGCLAELEGSLGALPHAARHVARLARHYRCGGGWAEAFAGVLAEVFAPAGLVLINPRTPALAAAAAPVHRRALVDAAGLGEALGARARALAAAGFTPGVHVRAGAPLSFFHPDAADGPRYRLTSAPEGFAEVGRGRVHSLHALLAHLDAEPLRFSTSALLRPILQDTILPTAAYVGGPAEVAYFAQITPLYAAYDLTMPLIVPRASFRIIDPATARALSRLGVAAAAAEGTEQTLLDAVKAVDPQQHCDEAALAERLVHRFEDGLREAGPMIAAAGPGATTAVEKTRGTVRRAAARLAAAVARGQLQRRMDVVESVRHVQEWLYPCRAPQERVCGLSYFAARFGDEAVVDRVLAAVAPFDPIRRDLLWPDGGSSPSPSSTEGQQ